jgi:uncharacterized membrane protein
LDRVGDPGKKSSQFGMTENNQNSRLEAFCDAVFAIALTLLIIDIRIPATKEISSAGELWLALRHMIPAISAFVLSFTIIFITWVNHHNSLKLINKSSPGFIYANALLLLTVVFVPFPTSMMGEYLLTDQLAPAAFLYNATLALQAMAWIFISHSAIKKRLTKNAQAASIIQRNGKFGYFAFALYSLFSVLSLCFPLSISIITAISWAFWLMYGIGVKQEEI